MPSFDIVNRLDHQEIDNALGNATREITTRYDFKGSDTSIEKTKKGSYPNRPWDVGNSPLSALKEWLKNHSEFKIDTEIKGLS